MGVGGGTARSVVGWGRGGGSPCRQRQGRWGPTCRRPSPGLHHGRSNSSASGVCAPMKYMGSQTPAGGPCRASGCGPQAPTKTRRAWSGHPTCATRAVLSGVLCSAVAAACRVSMPSWMRRICTAAGGGTRAQGLRSRVPRAGPCRAMQCLACTSTLRASRSVGHSRRRCARTEAAWRRCGTGAGRAAHLAATCTLSPNPPPTCRVRSSAMCTMAGLLPM